MAITPALAPWLVPAQRVAAASEAAGGEVGAKWHVVDGIAVGPGGVFAIHHGHRAEQFVLEVRGIAQRTEAHLAEALSRRGVQRWLDSTPPALTPAEVIEIRDALVAPVATPKRKRASRKKAVAA